MILVSHRLTLQRLKQVQRVLPLGLSRELREMKISHNFREVFTSACSRQRQRQRGRQNMSLEKNIFWSTLTVKSRGGKIFEFIHCPFEGRVKLHHLCKLNGPVGRC